MSKKLQQVKDDALLVLAEAILTDLNRRATDGTLAEDMKGMKLKEVAFQLNKIAEVLKVQGPAVNLNLPAPVDSAKLYAISAHKLTDEEREFMDRKMERQALKADD